MGIEPESRLAKRRICVKFFKAFQPTGGILKMKVFSGIVLAGVLASLFLCGCETTEPAPPANEIVYPYRATPAREKEIREGMRKLVVGMPKAEVMKIMGEPDEINKIYSTLDSMDKGHASGLIYVYLIQRKKKLGSFVERQEILVKLRFNLNDILTSIDKEGFK
jgi:outer membrane protein assembly factor BamE (lipoprotein component of BamABCDE complex)